MIVGLLVILAATTCFFCFRFYQLKSQIKSIKVVLEDVQAGNYNRRILSHPEEPVREICVGVNAIVKQSAEYLEKQKQSEKAYKQLMTNLSHDVRTPLTALSGYLEALDGGVSEEAQKRYIYAARKKAKQLKAVTDTLFYFARLDAGEIVFQFETTDLCEVLRMSVAQWFPMFENKGIVCQIEIPEKPILVSLDKKAFLRIMDNLFQNVIRHSNADKVEIDVKLKDDFVAVCVRDNGKGVPKTALPHLFERLYQCDLSRNAESTGLGLSIVKALVEAHNGSVWVKNGEEGGLSISFRLPISI